MDWGELLEPLSKVSPYYTILMVFFITFVVFGVMNILTSVFIEASSRITEVDWELVLEQSISEEITTVNRLKKIFSAYDVDNTGKVSEVGLEQIFDDCANHAFFKNFGIDVHQAQGFFKLLDLDKNDAVDTEEFIGGLMRMRGVAKGVDISMIMYENERVFRCLKEHMQHLDNHLNVV